MRTLLLVFSAACCAWGQATVTSPDGSVQLSIATTKGQLAYSVSYKGKPVVLPSALGLDIQDQPVLGADVKTVRAQPGSVDETYSLPAGKANPIRNVARTLTVELEDNRNARRFALEARVYDDGVAFRYLVPDQNLLHEIRLAGEKTEFQLAKDATTYPLILQNFRTSYEDDYHVLPLSGIHPKDLIALPLLADVPGAAWIAITEAYIDNYSGMYLQHNGSNAKSLFAALAPSLNDPGLAVSVGAPLRSPWRVIMIGDQPGRLVESNLVTNLNPACAIADPSWVKPGKTAWDWWSGSYAEGVSFKPGMNTETMNYYVDFAAEAGLPYMLIDAGWATRLSEGPNDSGSDLSKPRIDLPGILEHAKSKNVRIWLWAHWSDIARQMDDVFPLYEKWGIAGVKIDFMDRDDQWMVNYYRRVAEKAAQHHLMIDFHGAYKPDGLRRTYPNVLTREGVMGLEYNRWSARVTPEHNVTLPFTRMLAGPMDYTPGGFNQATHEQFVPQSPKPMVQGTRSHQLAMYVVFESGLQMLSDFPGAYRGQKELAFLSAVPNVWDESRVLAGRPREFIVMARRKGKEWYLGAMSNSQAREIDVPLEFLGSGSFTAEIYKDAADSTANPKHSEKAEQRVHRRGNHGSGGMGGWAARSSKTSS